MSSPARTAAASSVYRSLRLLADVAQNAVVASLAREGGLPSTFWAGPETIARSVRQGTHAVEGLAKRNVASLKLGFGSDTYGYSIDLGYPPPPPPATMFGMDPRVKRECIWHGPVYRKASALVDRRNNFVWLSTTRDEEPVFLTQHLADTDSMLASVADPQRAPEMLPSGKLFAGGGSTSVPHRFRVSGESRPDRNLGVDPPPGRQQFAATLNTVMEFRSDEELATTRVSGKSLYLTRRDLESCRGTSGSVRTRCDQTGPRPQSMDGVPFPLPTRCSRCTSQG